MDPASISQNQAMIDGQLPFVIGAGLGRTGTMSLHAALNSIGYKTYHMKEILFEGAGLKFWVDLAEERLRQEGGNESEENKRETNALARRAAQDIVESGYNATTDFPSIFIYRELMDLFPDAKVILSVRSSGDVWSESMLNTIVPLSAIFRKYPFRFVPFFKNMNILNEWTWMKLGMTLNPGQTPDKDALTKAHDEWNESVIRHVPKDRLLVHQSKDGFAPICKHLGVADSECPQSYPRVNDTAQFKSQFIGFSCVSVAFWLFLIGFVGFMLRKMTTRIRKEKFA